MYSPHPMLFLLIVYFRIDSCNIFCNIHNDLNDIIAEYQKENYIGNDFLFDFKKISYIFCNYYENKNLNNSNNIINNNRNFIQNYKELIAMKECPYDPRGYFLLISALSRVVLLQTKLIIAFSSVPAPCIALCKMSQSFSAPWLNVCCIPYA
jgi:hypothetical protein